MNKIVMFIILYFMLSCGASQSNHKKSKKPSENTTFSASNDLETANETPARNQVAPVMQKTSGSETTSTSVKTTSGMDSDPEDVPVLPPTAVAGSFLSDCYWSQVDMAIDCRIAEKSMMRENVVANPVNVQNIMDLFVYNKEMMKSPSYDTDKSKVNFVKIGFQEEYRGTEVFAKFNVGVDNNILNFNDVRISNIPPLRPDVGNVTRNPLVGSIFWGINNFKVGDDGLGVDQECPATESQAIKSNTYGRTLAIHFDVRVNDFTYIDVRGACGNGDGTPTDVPLGRLEIWDSKGKLQIAAPLPSTPTNNGRLDVLPSLNLRKQYNLPPGSYTLLVVPGLSPTQPGRLNDFVISQLRLTGAGLNVTKYKFYD